MENDAGEVILTPEEQELLDAALAAIRNLRTIFREIWESIPFSFDLDRSQIFDTGSEFAILEHSLIVAGVLVGPWEPLVGIYSLDVIARCGEQASIRRVNGGLIARLRFYTLENGDPVLVDSHVGLVVDVLVDMVEIITRFREEVQRMEEEMDVFYAEQCRCRELVWWSRPRKVHNNTTRRFGCIYSNIAPVTHLRMKLKNYTSGNGSVRAAWLDFCPAWGETTQLFASRGWRGADWNPLPHQSTLEWGPCSSDLKVYWWNVLGAENTRFEEVLRKISRHCDPRLFVITSTFAPAAMVYRVLGILGWQGHKVSAQHGGTWIVWDTSRVRVDFLWENADIFEFLMVRADQQQL